MEVRDTRARRAAVRYVVTAVLVVTTAAGCGGSGGGGDGDGEGRDGKDGAAPSASRTADGATDPAAPESARPGAEPSVTAADGDDTAACADGDCEIAVTRPVTFPFEGPAGRARLALTKVGADEVEYTVTGGGGGTVKGGAGGPGSGCVSVLRSGGAGTSCGGVGAVPEAEDGTVVLQVASGSDGTAVVTLVRG
ncbi:hypothetical protein [Streptomyces sp. NPDC054784]